MPLTQPLLHHVLKCVAFSTHSPSSTVKQIKTISTAHPTYSYLLLLPDGGHAFWVYKSCCETFPISNISFTLQRMTMRQRRYAPRSPLHSTEGVSVWMKTLCSLISQPACLCCDFIACYRPVKREQTAWVGGRSSAGGLCWEGRVSAVLMHLLVITGKGQEVTHRRKPSCQVIIGFIRRKMFMFSYIC